MIGLGEGAVSAIVAAGTLLLTLGIGGAVLVRNHQLRVHALSLGAIGPLVTLLSALMWGDGRMILSALLLFALLAVSSAVSAHAIMRLVALGRPEDRDPERQREAAAGRAGPSGDGGSTEG